MKKVLAFIVFATLIVSCGEKKEEKKDDFKMNRTKKETKAAASSDGVPVDLDNKGIGPVTSLQFDSEINTDMAAAGEKNFNVVCIACHQAEQRGIGPAMKGIYERRSPEWVMNMILNPSEMLQKDPIAMALFEEYGSMMTANNLTQEEAREVAEYLRTL